MAQIVTTDLVVRSEPGVHAGSEIYPTRLTEPLLLYVVDGPVRASGFDWYLVQPFEHGVCTDVCPEPLPFGWVAQAGQDGEVWLAPGTLNCPRPIVAEIQWLALPGRLVCFGKETLQLEGQFGGCFNEKMGGILFASGCVLHPDDYEVPADTFGDPGVIIRLTGDMTTVLSSDGSVALLPSEGALVRVTGQFDHPKAADCEPPIGQYLGKGLEAEGAELVLRCRFEFVASEIMLRN